jgi:hypothetical protein
MAKVNATMVCVLVAGRSETERPTKFGLEDLHEPAQSLENLQVAFQEPEHKFASHVESQILAIETKMGRLLATKNDDRAIRFASLGFQTILDSNAWLAMELHKHP